MSVNANPYVVQNKKIDNICIDFLIDSDLKDEK